MEKPQEKAPVAAEAEAEQGPRTSRSRPAKAAGKTLTPSTARKALPAAARTGSQARQSPHQGPWARLLSQYSEMCQLSSQIHLFSSLGANALFLGDFWRCSFQNSLASFFHGSFVKLK